MNTEYDNLYNELIECSVLIEVDDSYNDEFGSVNQYHWEVICADLIVSEEFKDAYVGSIHWWNEVPFELKLDDDNELCWEAI